MVAGVPSVGIGEQSVIRSAIVDKNARIGSGVKLLNEAGVQNFDAEDGSYYIREGLIIVPKNAVIKSGTVV
jgi:glucose-1-phosphate adenylyltransferase